MRPWPPGRSVGRWTATVVGHLDLQRVVEPAQEHAGVRPARMLHHVRQALLDDAERGQIGPRGQRPRLALGHELDRDARGADRLEQTVEIGEARLWRPLGFGRILLQDADQPAHLGHAVASRGLDPGDRSLRCLGILVEHSPRRAGLHHHHAHGVGHHVVQLARDPRPLVGDGVASGALPLGGDPAPSVVADPPEEHRQAGRERGGDQHLDPVGVRIGDHRAGDGRANRDRDGEPDEPLPVDVGGRRVGGHHQRERKVLRVIDRGARDRHQRHRDQHPDRPATPHDEWCAPERHQDEGRRPEPLARRVGRPVRGDDAADHGERRKRHCEQRVPHERVDASGAIAQGRSVHAPTVALRGAIQRHPAG